MSLWFSEPLKKLHGLFEEKVVLCFYLEVRIYASGEEEGNIK
jgi:hypothetical protein